MSGWQKLRLELTTSQEQIKGNPRLQIGLWATILIALLYVLLVVLDTKAVLQDENQRLQEQRFDQRSLANGPDWQIRAQKLQQEQNTLSPYFLTAANEAQGRASVQAMLGSIVSTYEVTRPKIAVTSAPTQDETTGLIPLQMRIEGRLAGDKLFALIHELESGKPAYRVAGLTIRTGRSDDVGFELLLNAWAQPWGTDE